MTFSERLPVWPVNLSFVVPFLLAFVVAALWPQPVGSPALLVADACAIVAIARIAGFGRRESALGQLFRRGSALLLMLLGYGALLVLLIAYPLQWLIREQSLGATLAVSTEAVIAVLALWRHWPAFGLCLVWRQACPAGGGAFATLSRCVGLARSLTAGSDLFFSHGLPVAFGVLLLAAGAIGLGLGATLLTDDLRLMLLAAYAVVVPGIAALIVNRTAAALLTARRRERVATASADETTASAQAESPSPPVPEPAGEDWNARLLRCARAGQTELALAALARGADPNTAPTANDRDQRSVVVLASLSGDMRLLRGLIARGADLNRRHTGLVPLLAATRDSHQGRPEAVMTLLTNGADPRCADADGNTPLHYAALSATPIVAALLCDAAAPIDAPNRDGQTPLAMACAAGNWQLARFLLDRGARAEVERGQPALLAAASVGDDDPSGVELLLKRKARVDARDALGRTALMIAALNGNVAIAEVLIDAGAQCGIADDRGTTALMEAARSGAQRVLELVARHDAALDAVDAIGRSALIIAAQSRAAGEAAIRVLVDAGASRDIATADGKRAVDYAAAAGRWNIVTLLDPRYPVPASVAEAAAAGAADPTPVLHLLDALRFGHWSIVEMFESQAPAFAIDDLVRLYLELAEPVQTASRGWLIQHGLRRCADTGAGSGLLAHLIEGLPATLDAATQWLAAGASPAGMRLLPQICSALSAHPAARRPLEDLALELIDRGAEIFAVDADGRAVLAQAVDSGSETLVAALLQRGLDPNLRDRFGRTPLFAALALSGGVAAPIVRRLIAAGANPELPSATGETPLGFALTRPEPDVQRWLNWPQWKPPRRSLAARDVVAAAAAGDADAVSRLLDAGLPADACDIQGAPAIVRAAGSGHAATVAVLLDRGADPLRAAPSGATALSAAVTARREPVIALLLERGVAVDSRLPTGGTPLMIAAALGFSEIVARLLARGAQVNASDERGTRPLHAAAQYAFRGVETDAARRSIELLIQQGADVDATNASGQTALLLLLGGRAEPGAAVDQKHLLAMLSLFLLAHADVDRQDERGVGPLHACAMHGLLQVARALLAAKADPSRRDVLERTPRQVAQLLGFIDLAAELGTREPAPAA